MGEFNPRIVLFKCQNCPSQTKDRMYHCGMGNPFEDFIVIDLPCLSRLDIYHVLKVIEEGADGVLVVGCAEGSCMYKVGVELARKRIAYVKEILESIGINESRVELVEAPSSLALKVSGMINERVREIRELGPVFGG